MSDTHNGAMSAPPPRRVFTTNELVNGPDDFPYTPVDEMDAFREAVARAPRSTTEDKI
jgi:hypothetical protein